LQTSELSADGDTHCITNPFCKNILQKIYAVHSYELQFLPFQNPSGFYMYHQV